MTDPDPLPTLHTRDHPVVWPIQLTAPLAVDRALVLHARTAAAHRTDVRPETTGAGARL